MRISDWSADVCSSDLTPDRRKFSDIEFDRARGTHPRPARDVGNRIVLGEIFGLRQKMLEHVQQPYRFVAITLQRIVDRRRAIAHDVMRTHVHRPHYRPLQSPPLTPAVAPTRTP